MLEMHFRASIEDEKEVDDHATLAPYFVLTARGARMINRTLRTGTGMTDRIADFMLLCNTLVHRGVQKIHPFSGLASPEPRARAERRQGWMTLLSAPVH